MLASNTAAIVDAYDVSRAVDRSAAFSGLLIGIFMAANLTGAAFSTVLQCFRPQLWSTHARRAMFWPLLCCSCGPLLYCIPTGLIYTGRGREWQEGLAALLLLSRILSGLGAGAASQVGLVCIAKGSSATEKSKHMVRFLFANMLGCGLGPLLPAFYHTVCPCHSEFGPQFWQLGVMKVILTLGSALAVAFCFPERLLPGPGPAQGDASGSDLESSQSSDPSESPTSQHRAELARLARQRKVVVGCLAMTGLRGYLITALEGATALFLQKLWKIEESVFMQNYGWELHTIGFMVALTFLMCIPGKLIQGRLSKCLSEKAMIRLFSIVAILGAVLICLQDGWVLLVADSLLFPCIYLSDAIGRGVMTRHLLPQGSWLDSNRASFWTLLLGGVGQTAGPWLTRWMLQTSTQTVYAAQQAAGSAVFLIMFELIVRPNMLDAVAQPREKMCKEESGSGSSVETLHQEADNIRRWLDARPSPGPETKRLAGSREDLAGTLASLESQISQLRHQLASEVQGPGPLPLLEPSSGTKALFAPARLPTTAERRAQQDILQLLQATAMQFQDGFHEADEVVIEASLAKLSQRLRDLRARYQDMRSRCEALGHHLQEARAQEAQQLLVEQGEAELAQLREEVRAPNRR
ncbi:CACNA1C [Symbiodinium sp. CCMP2456]|nr:CACNA1C [Symbiodinium sp. CCMP2456]